MSNEGQTEGCVWNTPIANWLTANVANIGIRWEAIVIQAVVRDTGY